MSNQVAQSGTPINLSASGAVSLGTGNLIGFYVNSTTSGTVVVRDGGASGTAISGTITPSVGFHPFPAAITSSSGCYLTLANTINVTAFFAA